MNRFEFIIPGRPVSQQTRRRQRLVEWRDYVRERAVASWSTTHARSNDAVSLTLVYLYREAALDADNIIKPILDALVGIALEDDSLVSDMMIRRRYLGAAFRLDRVTPVLAAAFDTGEEFIYVRVEDAPSQDELL